MSTLTNRTKDSSKSKKSESSSAIILSKFNTVYRHSVLDILTYYADIPTDPNPDNNPLRSSNEKATSSPTTLENSKASNTITNIKLKSIDFEGLTVSFKHPLVDTEMLRPIPFDQKCENWTQVEDKLIEMSKISATSRNLSNLRISGISYPTSIPNLFLIFLVLLLPFGYFYSHLLYDTVFANYLPFMLKLKPFHNAIFYITTIIHILEFYILFVPRINKYRVPLDYTIEWFVLTLLDGYESIKRFDAYVEMISPDDIYYDFTNNTYIF